VLFALRQPAILAGLFVGFAVGVPLRADLQRRWATRAGRGRLRALGSRRRARLPWTAYLDPYGTVAAVIAGVGWGPRPPQRGARPTGPGPLVIALVVHGALAAVGFAAFSAAGGDLGALGSLDVSSVLHGSIGLTSHTQAVALGFAAENLACGLLAVVPVPPLEAGLWLWSRLPRTPGARRLAYRLLEEPWGVVAILVLLLVPLGGQDPVLLALINALAAPVLGAL
jgi:hypothetical protein